MSTRYWRGVTLKSLVPKKGDLSLEMSLANQLVLGTRGKEIAGNPSMSRNSKSSLAELGEACPSEAKKAGSLVPFVPNVDDNPPSYPINPCPTCGGDYYLTDDNRWLCKRCHPAPVPGGLKG